MLHLRLAVVAVTLAAISDTVKVQLIVVVAALVLVVLVGAAGYLVRRKLGRIPPPPEQPDAEH